MILFRIFKSFVFIILSSDLQLLLGFLSFCSIYVCWLMIDSYNILIHTEHNELQNTAIMTKWTGVRICQPLVYGTTSPPLSASNVLDCFCIYIINECPILTGSALCCLHRVGVLLSHNNYNLWHFEIIIVPLIKQDNEVYLTGLHSLTSYQYYCINLIYQLKLHDTRCCPQSKVLLVCSPIW